MEEGILSKKSDASTPSLCLVYDLESTTPCMDQKRIAGLHILEVPLKSSTRQVYGGRWKLLKVLHWKVGSWSESVDSTGRVLIANGYPSLKCQVLYTSLHKNSA